MAEPMLDEDLELPPRRPRSMVPWIIGGVLVLVFIGIGYLYSHIEQKGISIGGSGHIAVMPNGEVWVFFLDGGEVKASPESVRKHHPQTGPCEHIDGWMRDEQPLFEIEELKCFPGKSIGQSIMARLENMGLKYGYWPQEATGQSLAEVGVTTEIVGSMLDPRTDNPQIVPIYSGLFPDTVLAERKAEQTPPPLIIQVDRNDFITSRYDRDALASFLDRPRFSFAGASKKGGWIVRSLVVAPDGVRFLENLLVNPLTDPWPNLLRESTLRVARRGSDARPSPEGGR